MTLPKRILKSAALRIGALVTAGILAVIAIVASFMDGPWIGNFLHCLGAVLFATVLMPGAAIVGILIAACFMELATHARAFIKWRRWGGKYSDYID